jgi:hypothetical protein
MWKWKKKLLLGEINEENCLVNTHFPPGIEDLVHHRNLLVENDLERLLNGFWRRWMKVD